MKKVDFEAERRGGLGFSGTVQYPYIKSYVMTIRLPRIPRTPLLLTAVLSFAAAASSLTSFAQKRVLNYPFKFQSSILADPDYDCYFLDNLKGGGLLADPERQ